MQVETSSEGIEGTWPLKCVRVYSQKSGEHNDVSYPAGADPQPIVSAILVVECTHKPISQPPVGREVTT